MLLRNFTQKINSNVPTINSIRNSNSIKSLASTHRLQQQQQQHQLYSQYTQQQQGFSYAKEPVFPRENGLEQNSVYKQKIQVPLTTIDQYVWNDINMWSDKVATVCGETGREYTYGKLRDNSAALATNLQQKFGLSARDAVAICLPNIPEYPIAALGAVEAGNIVTTINPIYTAEEISRQLNDSNAKLLIGTVTGYPILKEAAAMSKRPIPIICIRTTKDDVVPTGAINFDDVTNIKAVDISKLQRIDSAPDDVVFLPYSSGTTGLPKGVELSHVNIISNSEMLKINTGVEPIILPTTNSHQDCLPCVLPFFHIYGLTVTMFSKLNLGCKLVSLPRFLPDTFLNALDVHKGNVLHLVPPIIIFLGHFPGVQEKHTRHIRNIFSGAAPMGSSDAERFISRAPNCEFVQGYGLTETSPVVLMGSLGQRNYSSVGSPCPQTQAKIVALNDSTFTALGPNETGELLVRGPQVMIGYHNNKKATDDIMVEGGWLRTGDIAHYDDKFQFYITDRLKELIKVKGFQVAPAELEEILREHTDVAEAAVIGVPDKMSGELPRAFIVRKPNAKATEKELQEFVAKKVAVYKKLEGGVTFLEAIPKNASGKILRRELKLKYCS